MSITAKAGNFETPSEGTVQAVISNVYDLGIQRTNGMYGEKEGPQIVVMFEINETMKKGEYAGKRFVLSRTYPNIIAKKSNLKRDLILLVGESKAVVGYDLENLIGVNCFVTIAQNEKGYHNIVGMSGLPKGIEPMIPELPRDHKPKWIADKQAAQIVEDGELPEPAKKAEEKFNDPDGGFANADELERQRMIAEIHEWRNTNKLTMSKLIATTKIQTGVVITKIEDLEGLDIEQVRKVYNGVK